MMQPITDLEKLLTAQELKLGQCIVQGFSLRKAAMLMGITYETARDKLKTIYQKTGVNSPVQLALLIDRFDRKRVTQVNMFENMRANSEPNNQT
jgi:DNA-binding CsgD family transcriptional regulator